MVREGMDVGREIFDAGRCASVDEGVCDRWVVGTRREKKGKKTSSEA
jgi:hypothetical protein